MLLFFSKSNPSFPSFSAFLLAVFILCGSCNRDIRGCIDPKALNYDPQATKYAETCIYPYTLTQDALNAANIYVEGKYETTGASYFTKDGSPLSFTKEQKMLSSDSSLRFEFTNAIQRKGEDVRPASVFVQHVKDKQGITTGVYVMYKQPMGYWPEGGDWEYMALQARWTGKNSPNGYLPPDSTNLQPRGKIKACANCHAKAKKNFLFNDYPGS